MPLSSAKKIFFLVALLYASTILYGQTNTDTSLADSQRKAYLDAVAGFDLLEAYYLQAAAFPEDPATRLQLEGKLEDYLGLRNTIDSLLSISGLKDSLGLGARLEDLQTLDSRLRQLSITPALPLEEAYYLTAARHLSGQDEDRAIAALHKSLLANPAFIPSLSLRCRWHLRHHQAEKALADAISLSQSGEATAQDSLISLLPAFIKHMEGLRREEAHTRLLQISEDLINAYAFHPPSEALLTSLQEQSRQDMLRAYRNVSERALATGKRDLALRYARIARTQSEEWSLDTRSEDASLFGSIAAYAARAAVMALKEGQIRHSLEAFYEADSLYRDSLLSTAYERDYMPLLISARALIRDSIDLAPQPQRFYPLWHHLMEQHPGLAAEKEASSNFVVASYQEIPLARPIPPDHLPEQLRKRSRNLAFRIWQGDTVGYARFMDSLEVFSQYRDTNNFLPLVEASAAQVREAFHSWECRKEKMEDHMDAAALDRHRNAGRWMEAAAVLHQMQARRNKLSKCPFSPLPQSQDISLILNAGRYLGFLDQIGGHIRSGAYSTADSLITLSRHFYHRYLEGSAGPQKKDPYTLFEGEAMENYLLHRCSLAIQTKNLPEALSILEMMRYRKMDASRTKKMQEILGRQLAEKDLASTRLTNPKTLLAKHIPMQDWYNMLKKAYQKRFRKG